MGLPERIRVKISSEAAGYIALTPVVVQEMAVQELLEHIAAQTGGDRVRMQAVFRRGSTVSGASRLRWEPPAASDEELDAALNRLPGPEPGRTLDPARCLRLALSGAGRRQEIDRESAARRRVLKTRSAWDVLSGAVAGWEVEYVGYLYRERADHYRLHLDAAQRATVRQACALLRFTVQVDEPDVLELIVAR